jgi:dipeptide transport system ATP-binding protein
MALLEIKNLRVEFGSERLPFAAVDGVDFSINTGEIVGIVGESGSGKTVTALALMGLVDYPGLVTADRLAFAGRDLLGMGDRERRNLVGKDIAMIFQDPMSSLNPCYTIAFQLMEALRVHEGGTASAQRARALDLLRQVDIPDPLSRLDAYPHQLSGGMSQRVMIAMAIACNPKLLIADEPTTALDVTVQAQILELLLQLQRSRGMALMLITHDLAVVAQVAQRVVVMYAGQEVEAGPIPAIFETPRHPYTRALLDALPERNVGKSRIATIPGVVPGQYDRPAGCLLAPRCQFALSRCHKERPALTGSGGRVARCHYPLDASGRPTGDWRPEKEGGAAA